MKPNTVMLVVAGATWVAHVNANVIEEGAASSGNRLLAAPVGANAPAPEDDGLPLHAEVVDVEQEGAAAYSPASGLETFDAGFPDAYWSAGDLAGAGGLDFWDDVACNHVSGMRSAWAAGAGSQADCTLYDKDMDSYMCVEADYAGSSHNGTDHFYFSLWSEVEQCCDYGRVSVAGFKHEPLHGINVCTAPILARLTFGSTSLCGGGCLCHSGRCWTRLRVSLGPEFDGFPFLRICFRFFSDAGVEREGVYIDDVRFNGSSDTRIFPIQNGFDGESCAGTPVCGGVAGIQCPQGYECYFAPSPGVDCGTTDRTGVCRQYPPICPTNNAPVCGCNGVTYQNECYAARAHAEIANLGPCCTANAHCSVGEFCEKDDGECADPGECVSRPSSCSGTIARVCGCNGQTYDNRCKANQAGINVAHVGVCGSCTGAPFTIGGAVYSNCSAPLSTGIPDTHVEVTCGSTTFEANTSGPQGLWQLSGLPCGVCTVCPDKPGLSFSHVGPSCTQEDACYTINVNEANQASNQSIQFIGREGCTPFDMNGDGFPSITGDVPLAVDCIYRDECHCFEKDCICAGDCNCDGFLSVIGDVPCLVGCYYQQLCEDPCAAAAAAEPDEAIPQAGGGFTIGGAVYVNLNDPLSSGLANVTVNVACDGGFQTTAMTSGALGLWSVNGVAEADCTITPSRSGYCFEHVNLGVPDGQTSISITVDAAHQQQNQSIQFLASTDCPPATLGACCFASDICTMTASTECAGRYLGERISCSGDPDADGVGGCDDLCPATPARGGVDANGRPLGDLTDDCLVDLEDFRIIQNNFTGSPVVAILDGSQEVPAVDTEATGVVFVWLDPATNRLSWNITFTGIASNVTAAHFHGPALPGEEAPPTVNIGTISGLASPMIGAATLSDPAEADFLAGRWYVNIHSATHGDGEIRAQVTP